MRVEKKLSSRVNIVRKCHLCGFVMETKREVERCTHCQKSFLPLKYFSKIHGRGNSNFEDLFSSGSELHEEDLIPGLTVLWDS